MATRLIAAISLFGLFACAPGVSDQAQVEAALGGKVWQLQEVRGEALLSGTEGTIEFDLDKKSIQATVGCNGIGATYSLQGADIRTGPVLASKKACREPEGIMDQERRLVRALGLFNRLEVSNDSLKVYDEKGELLMVASKG